ncbi:MAG: LLM class flavin-dependent oxidoreductase [Pseudomonadota bacterium]|nr:LLM class flavin-dependent oxidoreductase [Pseudomonadota bacterium]
MRHHPKLHLGLMLTATGAHFGSWRLPESRPDRAFTLGPYGHQALTAERGRFDLVFLADTLALYPNDQPSTHGHAPLIAHLEPFTLLAALAAVTRHIGLAASASTTYSHPYHVARIVASLDHLSAGRAAWNLITSGNPAEAWNFGYQQHPDHADRYQRAAEFADVVTGLWDSWTADAFCFDKAAGRYFDPAGMRVLNHASTYFTVRGPLNMARSPQGRPVIAQAGSSEPGRALAARTAEIIFTAQQTFDGAKSFYDDIKQRVGRLGRRPAEVLIFPGIVPIVAATQSAADAKRRRIDEAFDAALGIESLSIEFGIDMSVYALDLKVPTDLPPSPKASSRRQLLLDQAARENLTLRQLAAKTASFGHCTLCGTAESIVDTLQRWFEGGAADGFMVMPASQPDGIEDFVDLVVPELRRRGLFRLDYESSTLRGHLGLPAPRAIATAAADHGGH